MRWVRLTMATLLLVVFMSSPAAAKCPGKSLGKDPRGDAPAWADLVGLMVMRCGPDIGIVFNVQQVHAASPIYSLVHARWAFTVDDRTFMVEAETGAGSSFLLSEVIEGEAKTIESVKGSYDMYNDFIGVLVPMRSVGAEVGSRVAGAKEVAKNDAVFEVFAGSPPVELDAMATSRVFTIPEWW